MSIGGGIHHGQSLGPPPVPPPFGVLGSNSNYTLYSAGDEPGSCANLTGVSVTIHIDEDLVGAMVGSVGYGFQLNAYSAADFFNAAQQYFVVVGDLEPGGVANLIGSVYTATRDLESLFAGGVVLTTLANSALPAGYEVSISLESDSNDNIVGMTSAIFDETHKELASDTITFSSLTTLTNGAEVTVSDMAPIVAFEVVLVGKGGGEAVNLSGGSGTVTYTANQPLTVVNAVPASIGWSFATEETANSVYGTLPAGPGPSFTQPFWVENLDLGRVETRQPAVGEP